MAAVLKVALIDDHPLLARSLQEVLQLEGLDTVVIPPDAVTAGAVVELGADLVVLDLDLGEGAPQGYHLLRSLTEAGQCVAVLTGETNRARLGACIEAGAKAVFGKGEDPRRLVAGFTELARTGETSVGLSTDDLLTELDAARRARALAMAPFNGLSKREAEVLEQLLEGHSADVAAERLYVSVSTVRTHIQSVLNKLGVSNQLAAVALAQRVGWPDRRTPREVR